MHLAKASKAIFLLAPGIDHPGCFKVLLVNVLVGIEPCQIKNGSFANSEPKKFENSAVTPDLALVLARGQ